MIDVQDSQKMTIKHGMGWLAIVTTLCMMLPGVAVMIGAFYLGQYDETAKPGASYALFGLGLFTFLIGTCTTFWRMKIVIDLEQQSVTSGWSVLGYGPTTTDPLDCFEEITVSRTYVRANHRSYRRDKVHLSGQKDGMPIEVYLTEYSSRSKALKKAREVAEFVGLPVAKN